MLIFLKKEKGFTLIELLVVVAIIGILSSVVLASLNTARSKARDAERVSEIRQLKLALELYYDKNGTYPTDVGWSNDCEGGTSFSTALSGLVSQGFISNIPKEPLNPSPWPKCYYYQYNNNCAIGDAVHPYILIFQAENTLNGYTSWGNETKRYCTYP